MNKFIQIIALAGVAFGFELRSDAQITIMPIGDSITVGVDYTTDSSGGYRDPLYSDLTLDGITPQFVGATNTSSTALLNTTGNEDHNGYGFYMIQDLTNNLNGDVQPDPGDDNQGGYWLTGGHGTGRAAVSPDIALLEIGTNDFLQLQGDPVSTFEAQMQTLLTTFHSLSPNTIILVAGCIPINNNPGFNAEISAYDSYIQNTLVPEDSYTRYVNMYGAFTNSNGSTISAYYGNAVTPPADNIHPDEEGYQAMAAVWANSIEEVEGQGAVPEPSTWAMIFGGLGLLAFWRRRA